jgi:hypothetical protein
MLVSFPYFIEYLYAAKTEKNMRARILNKDDATPHIGQNLVLLYFKYL